MSVFRSTDLVELARAKGVDGLTATEAAAAIFELPNGTKPTAPQREKARRRLDKLTATGLLTRVGGDTDRAPVAWFPVQGLSIDG
ncbi:Gp153 [Mycobacteroides abscessus subsp. abscessus]|nr:Gp153 [Mycobacteroides abscessus subsp. abscessus]